jgi:hypothetical protein
MHLLLFSPMLADGALVQQGGAIIAVILAAVAVFGKK